MIYAIDLDGTLCRTHGSDYEGAEPIPKRIRWVNGLAKAGHTIVIHTARGQGHHRDAADRKRIMDATVRQLERWGVIFHRIAWKIPADVYVDDRGIHPSEFFQP